MGSDGTGSQSDDRADENRVTSRAGHDVDLSAAILSLRRQNGDYAIEFGTDLV
jgi:hypothetical protein